MSNPDESQGDAAWRLLNALPAAHASTTSVSTGSGSGGTQSQVVLPSAEPAPVDAYRGFGLAGDSMDVDQDSEEQGQAQEVPGGGTDVFKKPFLPQPSPSQPPGPVQQAVASSSRAANKQPPSPVPMFKHLNKTKKLRAPSPDPPSQDSFGVPTGSQEHARHLRDNGGRIAQLVAEDNARLGAGPGRASPESSQTQSSSEPGDRSREIAEPVVLVAGTPSQSQSQSQDPQQEPSQSQNAAQDDDDDLIGGGQSSQMYEAFQTLPDLSMVDVEDEENAKSDDSFDARVQDEDDEENPSQLVATQVVEATQETQPLATATTSGALGTETGMSEQAQKLLRMHNPKRFQALQRSLRSTNASNSTSNPTPSNPSGPTPSVQQTHPTNTNNSVADRGFVHDGDETQQEPDGTQQEPEGTPPPGPLIETQLQSPPRTVPRKRQIPSAKSTQRPATAATSSTAPPPPPPVQTPQRPVPEEQQQHSSPATNNTHSGPSQTYSSSVVPPSVASEVSAPPMSRPPQSQFLSSSLIAPRRPREQDEEIVPDSNPPSSMSMGDTPSSQPVPLALMLTRKKESEALAKAQTSAKQDKGKGKAKEVPPVGKENENTSLQSDASLGPKRQPPTKHKYGGRRSGDERTDDAQALLALSKSGPGPRSRSASAEAFPGEEDMSLTSPSEGEREREPESQPPLKAGSPQRKRLPRRSPTVEATDPQPTRPPRRVVRGARRAVEPMISMEAVPEAAMDMDLDDAPPTQPTQRRSRAATRVRRTSAAAALRNLKEESDSEEDGGGAEDDGSYRETQQSAPVPPPAPVKPPARMTRKSAGALARAGPSTAPSQTQAQRGQKRRRVSDNATQPSQQTQRKRAKLEEVEAKMPTVFAFYKTDKKYYPATVTGIEGHSYAVSYADGCLGSVPADQLRPGPAVGEQVQQRIGGKLRTFTIVSLSSSGARVTEGTDGEEDEEELQWSTVFRTKAIAGTVGLTAAQIDALLRDGASEEPARAPVSTRATPAAPDHAARQYSPSERLKDLAFVLTCSAAGDRAWRDVLPYDIPDAQGKVLQDWTDVVRTGPPPTGSRRWCAKAADLVPIGAADKRAFLLTDVAVMTPKFLMALALGIPCVSMHWVFDVLEGKVDLDVWASYLLCAGEADHLGAAVSQMIATDANGNSPTVRDAVAADGWARIRRQRRMPFLGKTVLLVGAALVPTDEDQFTAQRCIPPVCLAMGASEVEAVRDFPFASTRRFDIVIVEDKARPASSDVRARMAVNGMVGNPTWVKQCLITGQLLAPPSRA